MTTRVVIINEGPDEVRVTAVYNGTQPDGTPVETEQYTIGIPATSRAEFYVYQSQYLKVEEIKEL